jgi:hypothetical protein
LLVEGRIFLEGAPLAAGGAVSGAEGLSAFGDATALATICTDVGAFFDHGRLLRAKEKDPPMAGLFSFTILSSEYQIERINRPK